jgi:HPt (histidine-containing phosphotransfer) domain-containing protein
VKFCVSQFADDPDMAELVTEYVGAFSDSATRIKRVFEERCFADLGSIAHQFKGSGGGYGFPIISDAAAKLEAVVKSPNIPTESQQLFIQKSVDELIGILELARTSLTSPSDNGVS